MTRNDWLERAKQERQAVHDLAVSFAHFVLHQRTLFPDATFTDERIASWADDLADELLKKLDEL